MKKNHYDSIFLPRRGLKMGRNNYFLLLRLSYFKCITIKLKTMKKIFKTTMAICLFIMAILVMNTFKAQAQVVIASENSITMRVGEHREFLLIARLGEIVDVKIESNGFPYIMLYDKNLVDGMWYCTIAAITRSTVTLKFIVTILFGDVWIEEVYIVVTVND